MKIEISDVKINGKKTSIKESFDSLEEARAWIDKCIFAKTRQELKIWIIRGMPNENQ